MNVGNVAQINERREYMQRIVAVTSFLGKHGMAFRGHRENAASDNQGNFLEVMKLLERFDPFLQNYQAPSHSTYLSPNSQNCMIKCCADAVTASIVEEIKTSKMYAVMADEARDGHVEQLAVCVRYVAADGTVKERLLELCNLQGFNAESITNAIEQVLESNGLNDLLCVAQAYDGASVMSGSISGVQTRFKEKHPEAVYIHCYAHKLNLVLCHTCKAVQEASELFETLESVYSYFSVSIVNHQKFSDVQKLLGLGTSELVQLSKSRWACQVKSEKAMLDNLQADLKCLEESATPLGVGLLSKLSRLSPVYLLVMFRSMLSTTEGLHVYLQKDSVDLAQATVFKDAVQETLKSMRTDEMADKLFNEAKTICAANNIPQSLTGRRHKQRRMEDFTVESTLGARVQLGTEDQLKQCLFYPCLDRMLAELNSWFSDVGAGLTKGIQACNPASDNFFYEDSLDLIATHYKMSVKKEEILVAKQFITRQKREGAVSDMGSIYKLLHPDMFPTLSPVLQAALTIPVSSCTCERSFSVLRRLHTWLRRTMGQDRLHHLAMLAIEKDVLCGLDHGDVIDRFAQATPRR
ncbi:zinc finger MYM-type protein 1-like [Epinephelus moara]|uniref:zinc finger MYM-type protein 1-like n=1 Tax=Epinephelus moara TaxID=300413 RepID=UPI00214F09ED|nr:zinc finger MYM-type protein 1-like [Epinephelus moara]